jgi:hypothetical protein
MKSSKLLIPLLVLPILAFIAFVMLKKHPPTKNWDAAGRVRPDQAAYQYWANDNFNSITPTDTFRESVYSIPITTSNLILTPIQKDDLHREVYNLLRAFSEPSYEYFKAFRFPITNGEFNVDILNYRIEYLANHNDKHLSLNDPELICKEWWDAMLEAYKSDTNTTSFATNQYYGVGFMKEVSFDSALLSVEEANQIPQALNFFVTSFQNDGYFDVAPIFHFRPSPEEILKREHTIQYAIMRLNVKTTRQPPMPVYFRFYWLSSSNKWLPIEHAMPSSKHKKISFCF